MAVFFCGTPLGPGAADCELALGSGLSRTGRAIPSLLYAVALPLLPLVSLEAAPSLQLQEGALSTDRDRFRALWELPCNDDAPFQ
jgi:hypothetical protein